MKRNFVEHSVEEHTEARNSLPGGASVTVTQSKGERAASERPQSFEILTESCSKQRAAVKERVILLVSDDIEFDKRLRMTALVRGQIIIRVDSIDAALRTVHTDCCGAVLLDLDLAAKIPWESADGILQDSQCPPVLLLSGRSEQFDVRMAIQAGSIFEKCVEVDRILNMARLIVEAPPGVQAERNMTQRGIIRWLNPYGALVPRPSVLRFWGLNE